MYDLDGIRSDFPLLSSVIYLDSAATCQTPMQVVEAMNEYYTSFRANHGRGAYRIAREATRRYDEARETVAAFIGAAPGHHKPAGTPLQPDSMVEAAGPGRGDNRPAVRRGVPGHAGID